MKILLLLIASISWITLSLATGSLLCHYLLKAFRLPCVLSSRQLERLSLTSALVSILTVLFGIGLCLPLFKFACGVVTPLLGVWAVALLIGLFTWWRNRRHDGQLLWTWLLMNLLFSYCFAQLEAWMQSPLGTELSLDRETFVITSLPLFLASPVFATVLAQTLLGSLLAGAAVHLFVMARRTSCQQPLIAQLRTMSLAGLVTLLLLCFTGNFGVACIRHFHPMMYAAMNRMEKADTSRQPLLPIGQAPVPVQSVEELMNGNYKRSDGQTALSADKKLEMGRTCISGYSAYQFHRNDVAGMRKDMAMEDYKTNNGLFGYGLIVDKSQLLPKTGLISVCYYLLLALTAFLVLYFLLLTALSLFHKTKVVGRVDIFLLPLTLFLTTGTWIFLHLGNLPWIVDCTFPLSYAFTFVHQLFIL